MWGLEEPHFDGYTHVVPVRKLAQAVQQQRHTALEERKDGIAKVKALLQKAQQQMPGKLSLAKRQNRRAKQ